MSSCNMACTGTHSKATDHDANKPVRTEKEKQPAKCGRHGLKITSLKCITSAVIHLSELFLITFNPHLPSRNV